MAEFIYNNTKNASTSQTLFEFNCGYHPRVFFGKDIDLRMKTYSAKELVKELRELIEVCCQNLLYVQELQKRAHDKRIKN